MEKEWCERWDCELGGVRKWQQEQCERDEWYCTECPCFVEKEIDSFEDLL